MSKLTTIPPLMLECCDDENFRYDLKKVFLDSGYLYATNGRILCRQSADDFDQSLLEELAKDRGKFPKAHEIWEDNAEIKRSAVSLPQDVNRFTPCESCGGKEFTECYECYGLRREINDTPVDLGPVTIRSDFVGLLAEHGVTEVMAAPHDETAIVFRCGNIEGLVMPMGRKQLAKDSAQNGEPKP